MKCIKKMYFKYIQFYKNWLNCINRDYMLYIKISQNAVKLNAKLFWKYVNENNKNSYKLPNAMSYLDKEVKC